MVGKNFGSMRYPFWGGFWFNAGSADWMLGKKCFSSGKQGKIGEKLWKRKVLSFVNQLYRSSCLFSIVYICGYSKVKW